MPMDSVMLVSAAVLIGAALALVAAAVWWQRRWMASTDRQSQTLPDDRP